MPDADLLVVGSGPAGIAAATAFVDAGGGTAVVVSGDIDTPYERPPLSKEFLRGEAQDDGFLLAAERLGAGDQIQVLLGNEATALDLESRVVTLADGQQLSFGACVLATGASPARPSIPGADLPGVYLLRSLSDGRALRAAAGDAQSAIVIGSGVIGCEAASSLARLGLAVTLLTTERAPQEARLGERTADRLAGWLREEGVVMHGRVGVTAIEATGTQLTVQGPGGPYTADLVLLATGITHNTGLGERAGLTIKEGRIRVDASMRTAVEGVYAAGDVALADNVAAGRPIAVEHWDDASTMGQIAGRNAAGEASQWGSVPGFWSQIGDRWLQYSAWGDGYDESRMVEHSEESFTVWYARDGRLVGVLTCDADEDFERGTAMIASGASAPM
jgi:3-phenylpropionate/trans-cinnamate dioxygenase ferredoxin reductase subunit